MNSRPELKLDWCSYAAAKYAVEKWHYSKTMPMPPWNCIGVWESQRFVGAVVFGRGASPNLGKAYGCTNTQVCELLRVALTQHRWEVTRMVSIAVSITAKRNPKLRLVVSFADTNQGHSGGIYRGGNWLYAGMTPEKKHFKDKRGRIWHDRQATLTGVTNQFGNRSRCAKRSECEPVELLGKHRFLMPLDDEMRRRIEPLRQSYPSAASQA